MPVPDITPQNELGEIVRCVSVGGGLVEFHHHGCEGDDGDFVDLGGEDDGVDDDIIGVV